MVDREKVIRGLEVCIEADFTEGKNPCAPCPYFFDGMCHHMIMKDALELLREQEPVEPDQILTDPVCGVCHGPLDVTDEYCRSCGRKVKWKNGG